MTQLDPDLLALQEVRDYSERAWRACEAVHSFSQEQVDALCKSMAEAGARAAYDLAKLAVEETGIGRVHYKVLKNLFGSEGTWASIKDLKTVGIVSRDEARGLIEVATPVGVVAGIIPTTNPTSTALFKSMIAVKGRNAIVISPHPRAKKCIGATAEVLRNAIARAGGPPDLVLSLTNPTIESTGALMKHRRVSVILATGGTGLVRAAYSSGKPAYGVGPGNVPCYIDRSADVAAAARGVVQSQSFDNGTFCCSEQGLVIDRPIHDALIAELQRNGAHVCDEAQTKLLAKLCNRGGHMNPDVVGQDPAKLAEWAGFQVPRDTTVLLAYQGGVGKDWPLSIEILAPVLSMHVVDGWQQGCKISMEMLHFDGLGHTCAVWARDERVLESWYLEKPASRIIVNGPSSQGAVGYSTNLVPSVSLGCGPQAGNITSDNISARHLVNLKRVAFPRRDWEEAQRRDHARAAGYSGDSNPRGSLLNGAPSQVRESAAPRESSTPSSNWTGNPVFRPQAEARPAPRPVAPPPSMPSAPASSSATLGGGAPRPAPAAPAGRAPTFTTQKVQAAAKSPAGYAPSSASSSTPASAPVAVAPTFSAPRGGSHTVGASLSAAEIQKLMEHAGAGCPLGPCKGCAHQNVATGACTA
ncbi:MAG: aldehyde dehydrogenase family protein [Planctomycetota bacterium]|nr:aldehyde dehydrogenase family protein [Planctomycetota bacterium]